ncbi:hypothetical protein AVEN_58001-1 [Araneus ventricosus]|uniref:Uncharacterized protein n=1 Tax=Araneus ventricosus TaxID=182803 RepID=A0A4Y2IUI7_ARAVE|nr:hypothetical protein AVEN_58001-1 [Araneus ventricosus]
MRDILGRIIFKSGQITSTTPLFQAAPMGERLATTYDLACSMPHARLFFSGIFSGGFRTWNPSTPKALTLPLAHRGLPFYGMVLCCVEEWYMR